MWKEGDRDVIQKRLNTNPVFLNLIGNIRINIINMQHILSLYRSTYLSIMYVSVYLSIYHLSNIYIRYIISTEKALKQWLTSDILQNCIQNVVLKCHFLLKEITYSSYVSTYQISRKLLKTTRVMSKGLRSQLKEAPTLFYSIPFHSIPVFYFQR